MDLLYPLIINLILSLCSFFLASRLISSGKSLFMKAGLKGKDLSKVGKTEIPESLGVVSGTVYLMCMFVFIPIPFVTKWMEQGGAGNATAAATAATDTVFPHNEFVEFIAALLSICCMILLGFADDILDLRWRDKLVLPTLASLPLLMVYYVTFGSTTIVIPKPVQFWLGQNLNLGFMYYVYMGMLAVFCTNAINILAGVNGLETGQSVVIGLSIIVFNLLELQRECWKNHLFSLYFIIPYVATSSALLYHNWYPSSVFVGDTFCYYSGMTFAVIAILGHFSKTMLLFFIPQILNFLYSIPQLFKLIPCPRHRLPKFNETTNKLEISTSTFKESDLGFLGRLCITVLSRCKVLNVRRNVGEDGASMEINNMTLINFVILMLGPLHERTVTSILLLIQVLGSCLGFLIRYKGARYLYEYD